MIIKWEMSIGFPGAERQGEAEVDDVELEGLTETERSVKINEAIWDSAMQYVDVYPTKDDEDED
jgi:hypothetical protein